MPMIEDMSLAKQVLVAMSGGVDSSVAAGLLVRAGYEVTGVFMCLGVAGKEEGTHQGCCSPQDARDAREVAERLGIRFSVINFEKELEEIIGYFVDEYRRARTPNPCIMCNTNLKFGKLWEYARASGIESIATGHYARIDRQYRLSRGVDRKKDQSYALFGIGRDNLSKIILPVGEFTKDQIRELAAEMKLGIEDKGESQEICFVADDDYARLVAERAPELCRRGKVLDVEGKQLGEHEGVFRFTIGQRKGLGIALGEPAYVVSLDAARNTVVLGGVQDLEQSRLEAAGINWQVEPQDREGFEAIVQIRYNHRGARGFVTPVSDESGRNSRAIVEFAEPVRAITPGQAAVFYIDNTVIGGGWIEKGN